MTSGDLPVLRLARAVQQVEALIAGIKPEQTRLPTPCSSWDVRALVDHLIADTREFTVMAEGGGWEEGEADVRRADWLAEFRAGAESLLAAWRRPQALDGTIQLPFAGHAGPWRVNQQMVEFTLHAGDLAKATRQPMDLDPELAEAALQWGRENVPPEQRGTEQQGHAYAPGVRVDESAPVYDRLAAFFGRQPGTP